MTLYSIKQMKNYTPMSEDMKKIFADDAAREQLYAFTYGEDKTGTIQLTNGTKYNIKKP